MIQRAKLWPIPLVHLSSLDDYMNIWVPDGVLDTHLILWTACDTNGMVIMPIVQMSKLRLGQSVTGRPVFLPRCWAAGSQVLQNQDRDRLA